MKDKISIGRIQKLHPKVRQLFTDFITESENTLNETFRILVLKRVYCNIEKNHLLFNC